MTNIPSQPNTPPPHTVRVDSGKYTFVKRLDKTAIEILRHGEPWHEQSNAFNALASIMAELDAARVVVTAARSLLSHEPIDVQASRGSTLAIAFIAHRSLVDDREPPSDWCGAPQELERAPEPAASGGQNTGPNTREAIRTRVSAALDNLAGKPHYEKISMVIAAVVGTDRPGAHPRYHWIALSDGVSTCPRHRTTFNAAEEPCWGCRNEERNKELPAAGTDNAAAEEVSRLQAKNDRLGAAYGKRQPIPVTRQPSIAPYQGWTTTTPRADAVAGSEANIDGMLHTIEGNCCKRQSCLNCAGVDSTGNGAIRHQQPIYGGIQSICERCPEDAHWWHPAGTYKHDGVGIIDGAVGPAAPDRASRLARDAGPSSAQSAADAERASAREVLATRALQWAAADNAADDRMAELERATENAATLAEDDTRRPLTASVFATAQARARVACKVADETRDSLLEAAHALAEVKP